MPGTKKALYILFIFINTIFYYIKLDLQDFQLPTDLKTLLMGRKAHFQGQTPIGRDNTQLNRERETESHEKQYKNSKSQQAGSCRETAPYNSEVITLFLQSPVIVPNDASGSSRKGYMMLQVFCYKVFCLGNTLITIIQIKKVSLAHLSGGLAFSVCHPCHCRVHAVLVHFSLPFPDPRTMTST